MNRNEKILKHINKNGLGVEIGPCANPIAPKKAGFKVDVIDHASREQLIAKYDGHGINFDNIEEVDFVWQGESYAELTGKHKYYDWIIASHVIEHTPDIIKFINDCDAILKDDGVLSLAIPDKRYCFDHYRAISGISKAIDTHLSQTTFHTPGTVTDHLLNVVFKSGKIAWDSQTTGEYKLAHSIEDARQTMNNLIEKSVYLDVHGWCFVPHSFRLMIHDLFHLGLISLPEVDFYPTDGCEFYMTLGRKGKGTHQSRLEMLEKIESELSEAKSSESIDLWEKRFSELEPVCQQLQIQLEQNQIKLQQTQAELAVYQDQLQASQQIISAMQTSKFWKLRTNWFKIKKALGLPANE
jgi:predicted SAM-dependent methyltransferase